MASETTLRNVMLLLSAAYPGVDVADQTPKLYHRMLADIPDKLLEAAVLDHISRSPYYPKVSELRSAVGRLSGQTEIQPAIEAWGDVCKAIRYAGSDNHPKFKNPITARIVEMMGWLDLCRSTNTIADRARFIDAYNESKDKAVAGGMAIPQVVELAASMKPKQLEAGWFAEEAHEVYGRPPQRIEYSNGELRTVPLLETGDGGSLDEG
jgi:hypothetical protein